MKEKTMAKVLSQREIAPRIYDLWLETGLAAQAKPGQFLCIYPRDKSTLLPRPISICEISEDKQALPPCQEHHRFQRGQAVPAGKRESKSART